MELTELLHDRNALLPAMQADPGERRLSDLWDHTVAPTFVGLTTKVADCVIIPDTSRNLFLVAIRS